MYIKVLINIYNLCKNHLKQIKIDEVMRISKITEQTLVIISQNNDLLVPEKIDTSDILLIDTIEKVYQS